MQQLFFENLAVYGIIWKNNVERIRAQIKKLAASSMLHEAKIAYYAFDVKWQRAVTASHILAIA